MSERFTPFSDGKVSVSGPTYAKVYRPTTRHPIRYSWECVGDLLPCGIELVHEAVCKADC